MIAAASPHDGKPLPRFVRDLLSAPPRRGEGLHNWLFRTARVLHAFRSRQEIIDLLRCATAGEPVKAGEIESAVDDSAGCAWRPGHAAPPLAKPSLWPELNRAKRDEIIEKGAGLADLWELSPCPRVEADSQTEEIIDALFPGDPLLCCGASNTHFATRARSQWRGRLAGLQFIVPSPMSAISGKTKDGRESQHSRT